jgi:hypothetical protein
MKSRQTDNTETKLLLTDEFHRRLHNVPYKKTEKQKLNLRNKIVAICVFSGEY